MSDLVETGGLFEGVTVAHFVPNKTVRDKMDDTDTLPYTTLVYTSESGVPTGRRSGIIVHDGSRTGCGRVVGDGAFTRLFMDWGKHGTPQYISNAAAYIAGGARSDDDVSADAGATPVAAFDYTGAPSFTCCITENDTAAGGFVMIYGSAPYNLTDDDALNDPVSAGLRLTGVAGTAVLAGTR